MVHLLSATTGELLDTITDAHDATITSMQVSAATAHAGSPLMSSVSIVLGVE
jgi:hypothetical protein